MAAVSLLISLGSGSYAATISWTNTAGGNWSGVTNWSPNRLPVVTDQVAIAAPGSYSVTLDVSAKVATLTLGGDVGTQSLVVINGRMLTLGGASVVNPSGELWLSSGSITNPLASLGVRGKLRWSAGTLALPTTISETGVLIMDGPATKSLRITTLENYGTVNFSSGGMFQFVGATTFNNHGTFNALTNVGFSRSQGTSAAFNNYGTFNKLAAGDQVMSTVSFANFGTLNIAQGRVNYTQTNHRWEDGSRLIGAGSCLLSGKFAHIQVNGSVQVDVRFQVIAGQLQGNGVFNNTLDWSGGQVVGDLIVRGTVNWTGGKLQGSLTIPEGATLNLSGGANKQLWFGTLNIYGTAVWTGTGPIEVDTRSVINNHGLFHAQNDSGWIWNNGDAPVFNNYGTFRKSVATGVSPLGAVQFANWGTFDVQSGTVSWTANVNTFHEGSRFIGTGTNLVNGATILVEGTVVGESTLDFQSGTIAGGSFAGTVNWSGGYFSNTVSFAPGGRLNVRPGGLKSLSGAMLVNAGTVDWQTTNAVVFDRGAVFQNDGDFVARTNVVLAYTNGATPVFRNAGSLRFALPPGTFSMRGSLVQESAGMLQAAVGLRGLAKVADRFNINGAVTLGGSLNVALTNGYIPLRGDRFSIVNATSLTGGFASVLGGAAWLAPEYSNTNLALVADAPAFVTQPQNLVVDAGATASFTAQVNRAGVLQWYVSRTILGQLVTTPMPNAIRPGLVLNNVQTNDGGFYQLTAANVWGAATSIWARLTVYVTPAILTQPTAQTVIAGSPVTMSVTVSGSGPFRFQWKRDGNNLAGQTNGILFLPATTAGDDAKYKVIISDDRTTLTSSEVALTVLVPPTVTEQPQNKNVNPGSDVNLSVKASGTSPFSYQWFKNGVPIAGANGNGLALGHITRDQTGTYQVMVANAAGSAFSANAVVLINEPPVIIVQPLGQSASVGTNVVLAVVATGVPAPTYQWERNGVKLAGATQPTLLFNNAQPRDSGHYQVVVANSQGSIVSAVAELQVLVPSLPFADNFGAGGILYTTNGVGRWINCGGTKQTGEPSHAGKGNATNSVWISWWAPANGIATFSTLGSDFDTVLAVYRGASINALTKIAADDDDAGFHCSRVSFNAQAGTYYQIAVAGVGGTCGDIILNWDLLITTELLPQITQAPLDVTGNTNDLVTLQVLFDVFEPTAIQWFYQGQMLAGATNATHVIPNLQEEKVGGYAVRLTGLSGRSVVSAPGDIQINTEGASGVSARNKFFDAAERALTP